MKPFISMSLLTKLTAILLLIISIMPRGWADESAPKKTMVLRQIMQELDSNIRITNNAISREDWTLVAKTALLIAEHPEPPFSEKLRILAFFGRNISQLKQFDSQTHQAAKNLATAAQTADRQNVISSFSTLEQSCANCHQAFKNTFVKHFYQP